MTPAQHARRGDLQLEQQLGTITSEQRRELAQLDTHRIAFDRDRQARRSFSMAGELRPRATDTTSPAQPAPHIPHALRR